MSVAECLPAIDGEGGLVGGRRRRPAPVADVPAEAGYRVLRAEYGPSGVEQLRSAASIDLLVTMSACPMA